MKSYIVVLSMIGSVLFSCSSFQDNFKVRQLSDLPFSLENKRVGVLCLGTSIQDRMFLVQLCRYLNIIPSLSVVKPDTCLKYSQEHESEIRSWCEQVLSGATGDATIRNFTAITKADFVIAISSGNISWSGVSGHGWNNQARILEISLLIIDGRSGQAIALADYELSLNNKQLGIMQILASGKKTSDSNRNTACIDKTANELTWRLLQKYYPAMIPEKYRDLENDIIWKPVIE